MSARAAALGIGYQLWLRSRWLLLAIMAGALVLSIVVHLIPSPEAAGVVALLGSLPIGFAAVMLVGIVAYSGDISATESGFPRHMMVLPLSNRAMALTPLLYGVACVAALWMIVVRLVLMPGGWPVPILWPAVMLAALTVWLQATSWMPFWFPFARMAACVGSLFAVCGFACVAQAFQFPELVLLGGLLAATVLAMPIAVAGVARARRGAGSMPSWISVLALPRASVHRRPFASPERAQVWLELRRNCIMLPVFILPVPLLTLLVLVWVLPGQRDQPAPIYLAGYIVPAQLFWSAACLLSPPLMAAAVGANIGKLDAWGKQPKMTSFVAVRPMADATLVIAKLKASALSVAITWALTLAILITAWFNPHSYGRSESLTHALIAHATARRVIVAALLLAFLILRTWLNVIESFSVSLYGRTWLLNAVQFFVLGVFVCAYGLAVWTSQHPQVLSWVLRGAAIAALLLIVAKVGLAGAIIRAGRRCYAASSRQLIIVTLGWFLLLAAQFAALLWLVPPLRHSLIILTACLVLFVPYNRLIAMPLAWHHNRHR